MKSNSPLYLGVMSGTSLDGTDVVAFDPISKSVIAAHSIDFSDELRRQTLSLQHASDNELHHAQLTANALADLYSRAINELMAHNQFTPAQIAGVGVHGQTIRHRPELGYTVQLNQPARIAEQTGLTIVSDFRARDVAAGGQGAPLVPAFHDDIWRDAQQNRVVLNIGGFANISVLNRSDAVFGYDTGPGNVLMDAWIQQNQGLSYDANGDWAASGCVHEGLLAAFLSDAFFSQPHPKSTGRDSFHLNWLHSHLFSFPTIAPADVQATLLELTAISIRNDIKRSSPNVDEVVVCGGGAFNACLLNRLRQQLPTCTVKSSSDFGINPQHAEAAAFAWLAWCTLNHLSGNLPAVTGAAGTRILGNVTFA